MASTSNSPSTAPDDDGAGPDVTPDGRFPVRTFPAVDPTYVLPDRDGDRATCRVWTVHLDTGDREAEPVGALGERLALLPSVRGYLGGDDFGAWAEPFAQGPADGEQAVAKRSVPAPLACS